MRAATERRIEAARRYSKRPGFTKLWRYTVNSGISTVFSLSLLFLFYRVAGLSPGWSNIAAVCIATVPYYYLNRAWAFGKTGRSHLMKEVLPFWLIAIVSLVLSTIAVRFAGHQSSGLKSKDLRSAILVGANFSTYAALWVAKFLLFDKVLFKRPAPISRDLASDHEPVPVLPVTDVPR